MAEGSQLLLLRVPRHSHSVVLFQSFTSPLLVAVMNTLMCEAYLTDTTNEVSILWMLWAANHGLIICHLIDLFAAAAAPSLFKGLFAERLFINEFAAASVKPFMTLRVKLYLSIFFMIDISRRHAFPTSPITNIL